MRQNWVLFSYNGFIQNISPVQRMIESATVVVLTCLLLLIVGVRSNVDPVALQTEIVYEVSGVQHTEEFVLSHKQVPNWRRICAEIIRRTGVSGELLISGVQGRLKALAYPDHIFGEDIGISSHNGSIYSHQASQILYSHAFADDGENDYFWLDPPKHSNNVWTAGANKYNDIRHQIDTHLYPEKHSCRSWLPHYLRANSHINSISHLKDKFHAMPSPVVFYQTIGASTGGTTAMSLLHRALYDLGYNTIICNDTNRFDLACTSPHGTEFTTFSLYFSVNRCMLTSCVGFDPIIFFSAFQ